MKDEKEKKEAALKEELTLLGNMMKQHEWTQFGQEEAEEEAELESTPLVPRRPKVYCENCVSDLRGQVRTLIRVPFPGTEQPRG